MAESSWVKRLISVNWGKLSERVCWMMKVFSWHFAFVDHSWRECKRDWRFLTWGWNFGEQSAELLILTDSMILSTANVLYSSALIYCLHECIVVGSQGFTCGGGGREEGRYLNSALKWDAKTKSEPVSVLQFHLFYSNKATRYHQRMRADANKQCRGIVLRIAWCNGIRTGI